MFKNKKKFCALLIAAILVSSFGNTSPASAQVSGSKDLDSINAQLSAIVAGLRSLLVPDSQVLGARTVSVSSREEFTAAIIAAQGGDVIELAPGDYGTYSLIGGKYNQLIANGVKYSGKTPMPSSVVTITSKDKRNPAIFSQLTIGTANWVVDGLAFQTKPAVENRGMFTATADSKNVTIKNSTFMIAQPGDSAKWTKDEWKALTGDVRLLVGISTDGQDTTIENNYVHNIQYGIQAGESSDGSIIRRNTVDGFTIDGIRALGDNSLIEANLVKNSVQLSDSHNDCMQSWSRGADGKVGTGKVTKITIRGNKCISNENPNHPFPGQIQGIGFFDGSFYDLLIEDNIILSDIYHGIALYGVYDSVVRNNTVLDITSERPGPIWIRVNNHKNGTPSGNVVIENNVTNSIYGVGGTITEKNNVIVPFADYSKHFANIANFDAKIISAAIPSGVGATPREVGSTLAKPQLRTAGGSQPTPTPTPTPTPEPEPTPEPAPVSNGVVHFAGLKANQKVKGLMTVEARPKNFTSIQQINFLIDSKVVGTDTSSPYELKDFDTSTLQNGLHMITLEVVETNNARASSTIRFYTDNSEVVVPSEPTVPEEPEEPEEPAEPETPEAPSSVRVTTTDNLRVRISPNGAIITVVKKGTVGTRSETVTDAQGVSWSKVAFDNGVSGYVASEYLTENDLPATGPGTPALDSVQAKIESLMAQVRLLLQLLSALQR